jgi:mono/diheme cytochrome c family protein
MNVGRKPMDDVRPSQESSMHNTANAQFISYLVVGLSSTLALACTGVVDYPTPAPPGPSNAGTGAMPVSSAGQSWGGMGNSMPNSSAGTPGNDCPTVETQALAVLQSHCASCHGPGTNTAGFNTVLDVNALEASGKIVPGDALKSPLYKRIANGEMPPPAVPGPSTQEVAVLYSWIEGCRGPGPMVGGTPGQGGGGGYFDRRTILSWMLADLNTFDLDDRKFIRYLTLTQLHNAGIKGEALDVYRYALAKAVNALSQGTRVVAPKAIDDNSTVYRIDLRDYEWDATASRSDKWDELVAANPYAIEFLEDEAEVLKLFTGSDVPVQTGDWLVNAATRPPLYHTMLDLPTTLAGLEAQLGLNLAQDIQNEDVWRAGFLDSGVSFQNRVIERHEIPVANNRSLWISYDFADNGGRENIFADPLDFEADGSELIFSLPNGLHAYMIVNAAGQRLDAAPDNIVVDPLQQNRDVVNGISCMSCHTGGTKPKDDELREYVENSADFDFATKQEILQLHPVAAEFQGMLDDDADVFKNAVTALSPPPNMPAEPIIAVFNKFDENVDLKLAAAELGVRPEVLLAELGGLDPGLSPLAYTSIKRDVFREAFAETVCRLNIGLANAAACASSNASSGQP